MLCFQFNTQETVIKTSEVSQELDAAITNMLVADEGDVDDGVIFMEERFMMDDTDINDGIDFGEHERFLWYHLFQLLVVLILMTALLLVAVFRLNWMQNPTSDLPGASVGYLCDNVTKLFHGTMFFFSSTEDAKSSRMPRKSFGSFKRSAKLFVMSIFLLALVASDIVSSETEPVEEDVSERRRIVLIICGLFIYLFRTSMMSNHIMFCFLF